MKKAIIFDCDNTLWKGIVGEEEIKHDTDLQQDIIFFANHGVIIGLCSKNNETDVIEAMKDQLLTEKYISVKRINWNDKASNLKEIAEELNVGLDAIVFVDDSEFERELVKKQLPEVMTITPQELTRVVLDNFDLKGNFTKTQQYKENYQRAKAKEQFTDINEYLASLDMVLKIEVNESKHIPRIVELTQKTNQFNLTSHRCNEDNIKRFMASGYVYTLSVKDKFGDNGLTGVCAIYHGVIDIFLLSCRILGRGIEYAFIDKIMKDYKKRKSDTLVLGIYVPTSKNGQVADFYPKLGFNFTDDKSIFTINSNDYKPHAAKYFRYE
jgi:FkbH-like protein